MKHKLSAVWRVLRGKPVCYRMRFYTGKGIVNMHDDDDPWLRECVITGDTTGPGWTVSPPGPVELVVSDDPNR